MKKFLIASAFALACGVALAEGIVIPEDNKPFMVEESDVVRLFAKGIAGTNVKANVKGPAKAKVRPISTRINGAMPIGSGDHDVEVTPTGKGKVEVEITITPPGNKAEKKTYEFEVK